MNQLGLVMLFGLLAVACRTDLLSHRIPNPVVFAGAALGILWNGLSPYGHGWAAAFEGMGIGLAFLMPLYFLRAMSAGDVKLLAMVGSFLGPIDVIGATLATFLMGGAMAVAITLKMGVFQQMLRNLWFIVVGSAVRLASGSMPTIEYPVQPAARLPYGVAITAGTAAFVAWQRSLG